MGDRTPDEAPEDGCRRILEGVNALSMSPDHDTSVELTRPLVPLDPVEREAFGKKVASTKLGSNSDGLIALLRDYPNLVSTQLAEEAERELAEKLPGPLRTADTVTSYVSTVHGDDISSQSELFPQAEDGVPKKSHRRLSESVAQFPLPDVSLVQGEKARRASMRSLGTTSLCMSRSCSIPGEPNLGTMGTRPDYGDEKIVVAMVGLPARGKSFLSNKLMRYLRWREYKVRVFNVGQLRRAVARERDASPWADSLQNSTFFDSNNAEALKVREALSHECLEQLIRWLKRAGHVGIHDATNTTKARRRHIAERVAQEPGLRLVFLESVCTDPEVVLANVEVKVRSRDPDYMNMNREQAREDFLRRIKHYEAVYEPLDADGTEQHYSYCKIVDVGRSATMNLISSYLGSQIAFYLLNLHIAPRNIFMSRHGESQFNLEGKIGGDSDLSERGWAYARALPKLIQDHVGDEELTVWHSSLRRTGQTASLLPYPKLVWKSLDELDAGVCDGMTYEEIEKFYPEDSTSRDEDKFNYRYRGGESYRDVVVRLEPVIMELERQSNILIIGHQAILRALYAYFMGYDQNELPYIKIPLHTVIKLTPKAYGCDEERYALPIEAVDTHHVP
ncbi:Fructose-2,6-bisphosphatase [Malassezia caprae]|uniref:fructose-2,6-bisphosphate 2-phosphatase n=1 Tax=Malassezia caprae TaxID=1381934 RepID=A0AAF0E7L3_9BASI|nr:Fructose-2,6-bisphosphatase [Malassezia caprae]